MRNLYSCSFFSLFSRSFPVCHLAICIRRVWVRNVGSLFWGLSLAFTSFSSLFLLLYSLLRVVYLLLHSGLEI